MADIDKLVKTLKELDDLLANCMRCGMCQAVCPVFAQTGKEADVTRGKLALLDGLASEIIKNPDGVNDTLNKCLMCGTCEANCPSGVKITDIFLKARSVMAGYYGLDPIKKVIFKGMLANPRLFNALTSISSKFQGIFVKKVDPLLGSSCARISNLPVVSDRHFNSLAKKPFRNIIPHLDTAAGKSGMRVAFYPGCVVDKMYTSVGTSVVKALEHHGVGIFMPKNQACCGIPVLSSGDRKTFNTLVELNVDRFKDVSFDYLVTPCASCTSTIKELWPRMYDGDRDISSMLESLEEKTMDISQFLVDKCGVEEIACKTDESITYHDPCHLKNALGVSQQPRTLIKAAGQKFQEMTGAGTCCGCGGTFTVYHHEMSKKIGNQKAENIISSGAKTVATGCPACMMQMTDMLSRRDRGIGVKHVVEIYADSL